MGAAHSHPATASAHHQRQHKPTHAAHRCKKCGAAYTAALLHDDAIYGAHGQAETAFCPACHSAHTAKYKEVAAAIDALHESANTLYRPELVWDHRAEKKIGVGGEQAMQQQQQPPQQADIVVPNPASPQYGLTTAADGTVINAAGAVPFVPTNADLYRQAYTRHTVYPNTSTGAGLLSPLFMLFNLSSQPNVRSPRMVSPYQMAHLMHMMHPSVPMVTIFGELNPCQAVAYVRLVDQVPSALPGASLFGGAADELYFAVKKLMPYGPVLNEPGTQGFWLVPAAYVRRLPLVAVFLQGQDDVAVMLDYRGRMFTITYKQYISDTRWAFVVARYMLFLQYPALFATSAGVLMQDTIPEEFAPGGDQGVPQALTTQPAALRFSPTAQPPADVTPYLQVGPPSEFAPGTPVVRPYARQPLPRDYPAMQAGTPAVMVTAASLAHRK